MAAQDNDFLEGEGRVGRPSSQSTATQARQQHSNERRRIGHDRARACRYRPSDRQAGLPAERRPPANPRTAALLSASPPAEMPPASAPRGGRLRPRPPGRAAPGVRLAGARGAPAPAAARAAGTTSDDARNAAPVLLRRWRIAVLSAVIEDALSWSLTRALSVGVVSREGSCANTTERMTSRFVQ